MTSAGRPRVLCKVGYGGHAQNGAHTGGQFTDIPADYTDSFQRGVHDFVDAILEGRPSELTGPEGRDVLRFSLAVLLSGKEGREVAVNEIVD